MSEQVDELVVWEIGRLVVCGGPYHSVNSVNSCSLLI